VLQPEGMRDAATLDAMRSFEPDILAVASYGELLRQEVLDLAPRGAINVHGSLLPRWRGASPVQAAILAGDERTGISIQQMVLELDAGDLLHEVETQIATDETAGDLFDRLAQLGGHALVEALDGLQQGTLEPRAQDPAQVTHCRKIRKEQGRLMLSASSTEIIRQVRAMTPWPGAWLDLPSGSRLVVLKATEAEPKGPAGTLQEGADMVVNCGEGAVRLEIVKPAGKGPMEGAAFLRGARLEAGTMLEVAP